MTKKRLPPTPDDVAAWRAHVGADRHAPPTRPNKVAKRAVVAARAPAVVAEPEPKLNGRRARLPKVLPAPLLRLDPHDQKAIRRGRLSIDARIDLHGMTQIAAHRRLTKFLHEAWDQGLRVVLVITGKGAPKADPDNPFVVHEEGVLKRALPEWLDSAELAPLVVSSEPAQPKDGGAGARYVRLRKRRDG